MHRITVGLRLTYSNSFSLMIAARWHGSLGVLAGPPSAVSERSPPIGKRVAPVPVIVSDPLEGAPGPSHLGTGEANFHPSQMEKSPDISFAENFLSWEHNTHITGFTTAARRAKTGKELPRSGGRV